MLICGVKASHDGAVALVEDGRLVFSVEMEKLDNALRYSPLGDLDRVGEILRSEGVDPAAVDRFVVDGWWPEAVETEPSVPTARGGQPFVLPVAGYLGDDSDPVHRSHYPVHDFGARGQGYASYVHAADHLMGAYCSSPFAARGEDALVLVWDGGMTPRLYAVDAANRSARMVVELLPVYGNFFGDFCSRLEPFLRDTSGIDFQALIRHHLSIAGKAMAYAALGTVDPATFAVFDRLIGGYSPVTQADAFALGNTVASRRDELTPGLSNADLIASFQEYLGRRLVDRLALVVQRRFPRQQVNLCVTGGCALNIKWNSMIRDTMLFESVWVPPFPNDSGQAIGAAAAEMFTSGDATALDWNVYSGPSTVVGRVPTGWGVRDCDERGLALLLHEEQEPVVVLAGRAEIGPRALGNRSILAPAVSSAMKDRLNLVKGRESYRPVAPICLTARADEVFAPGGADPYMLFEHRLRDDWAERVPAVVHLDGTARLQTIDPSGHGAAGAVLAEYEKLSGIPVLCNTSANLNGHGFFPDVETAIRWGRTRYVWSEGTLYTNPDPTVGGTVTGGDAGSDRPATA